MYSICDWWHREREEILQEVETAREIEKSARQKHREEREARKQEMEAQVRELDLCTRLPLIIDALMDYRYCSTNRLIDCDGCE